MLRFILRRSAQALLVLLVMSFVIYSLIGLMPGDPIDVMIAGNPGATPEVVAHLRQLYGLDQPLPLRYWHWLSAALGGDLGFSRTHSQPVLQVLLPALAQTSKLMLTGWSLSVVLAFILGTLSAMKPGSSPSICGAGERASLTIASPAIRVRVAKFASVATGAKRLHSMEKPSRAMRGPLIGRCPAGRRSWAWPSGRTRSGRARWSGLR